MIRAVDTILTLALAAVIALPAGAEGLRVRTSLGATYAWAPAYSLDAALGFANRQTETASLRLMWNKTAGAFRFEIHSQTGYAQGSDVAYGAALAPFLPAAPPATYFDMTQTWLSAANRAAVSTIDRLNVTYTTESLVLRVGRQAITWGSGTVFHPADIVAPFSPSATDTSYKTGADMVYLQYLFESGADVQLIGVPRPAVAGGPVDYASSTYAARARTDLGSLEASLMLAHDRGDTVGSLSLSGALGGASWNAEYVGWQLAGGGGYMPSWLANISNFGTFFGLSTAYFAEAYHNGFGVDSSVALDSLPASLSKRMATGQVFYAGRDFLALGARIQITPDLTLSPTTLVSFDDHSSLFGLSASYTLSDNTSLMLSYFRPIGSGGTEFGGRETATGSGVFATPAETLGLRLVHYF